jgi:CRISPR-associated protein Cas1
VKWAREVRSGDPNNLEARGAAVYWRRIFPSLPDFSRGREGPPPNHLLNYGYAILRAMVARALVGTGLHPALGIHHINQYNPFALADDCMEPFRPWVDARAYDLWLSLGEDLPPELTPELKKQMLPLTQDDVAIDGKRRPLQNAIQLFAASFAQALSKPKSSNLLLPDMEQTLGWRLLPEPPEMDESDVGLTPA